jgi:uncharacterized protein YhaN
MRILRIALRSFRGVSSSDVRIPGEGVTVIEGANEIGKSSLAEAIDLIFEEPDSSAKQRVKAVKPVDADVGAEVEVELTVGGYHVVYWKRWHRQPQTTLRILAPAPRQYTGREAHDRMNEILDESIDRALWKALRYQQGIGIEQATVGDSRSLLAALDAAAAGKGLGDEGEAEDLWSRVGKERERYFTSGGKANAARTRLDGEVEAVRQKVARLARELAELEAAAESHRRLQLDLTQIAGRLAEQGRIAQERAAAWSQLQKERLEVERLAADAERATSSAEKAGATNRRRLELVEQLRIAGETLAGLADQAQREAPGLEAAATAAAEGQRLREEAREAHRSAEQTALVASQDFEYFRELLNLEMQAERHGRVQEAERRQGEALAFLDGCLIDAARLEEIEKAFLACATARARLSAESASVRVEAVSAVELEVNGRERPMAAGQVVEEAVAGSLEILLPRWVRMTVTSGARTRELEEEAADAKGHLEALYAAAGVSGDDALMSARELERRRRSTMQTAEQAARALQENLRDLTPQGLAEMIDRARSRTQAYLAERSDAPPLPSNREEAQMASEQASAHLRLCRDTMERRDQERELADQALRQVENATREREFHTQAAEEAVRALAKDLAGAREATADDQLAADLAAAEAAAAAAQASHRAAADRLEAHNPEQAEALADNARTVLSGMEQSRREVELELAGVKSLLDIRGEAGLHDQLDSAQSEQVRLEREKERTDHRAEAVDLLHRVLGKHRDAAKRTYVAPLRQQLESFGRVVFGADLSIGLDHETLSIVSRTLAGATVPYDSLSMGAKEQLSLLARLACAVLVTHPGAADPGVPVIVDDALGNSDPERLERLGAVLAVAGRQVQVIVLTCTPDRYRNVGSANVIRLAACGPETKTEIPMPGHGPSVDEVGLLAVPAREEEEGFWEARVMGCLAATGVPLGKSEIILQSGLPDGLWQAIITSLVTEGRVLREGEKRGTRYRLP